MALKPDPTSQELFDRAEAASAESKRLREEAASLKREADAALAHRKAVGISDAEWRALRAWRGR